jgi:hypothetical protein
MLGGGADTKELYKHLSTLLCSITWEGIFHSSGNSMQRKLREYGIVCMGCVGLFYGMDLRYDTKRYCR